MGQLVAVLQAVMNHFDHLFCILGILTCFNLLFTFATMLKVFGGKK